MTSIRRVRAIEPIAGEKYRFHVPSDTLGAYPYLVDLESHFGEGECACNDFQIARLKLRKVGEVDMMKRLCKHLKRAFIVWAMREIKRELREAKSRNPNKPTRSAYNTHA
jgi:hypothetical protein